MRHLLLIFTATLLMVVSCTTEEPILQKKTEMAQSEKAMTKVSQDDALKIAELFMGHISSNQTRASQRKVSTIDVVLSDANTRAEASDTLLYIINYENDEGYAIVSADTRAYPVFAISDSGFFEINDETNEGVSLFLENAKETTAAMIENNDTPVYNPENLFNLNDHIDKERKIGPLISERQRRVGNCPELNKYCYDENGNKMWTCCVPVAVEIAMSYHKWPKTIGEYIFNWDAMNEGLDDDGIARLLAILGSYGYCKVFYSEQLGYYSYSHYVRPTLTKCYYTCNMSNFATFTNDVNTVKSHLGEYGPLLIYGRSASGKGGHLWIIDGYDYIKYSDPERPYFPTLPKMSYAFYHCIWGNPYGGCNGYYLACADKYFDGAPDLYDPTDAGNNNGEEYWHFSYYDGAILYLGEFKPYTGIIRK